MALRFEFRPDYDFHPEFGYLCPSPGLLRRMRTVVVSALFGAVLGGTVVLVLTSRENVDLVGAALAARVTAPAAEVPASEPTSTEPTSTLAIVNWHTLPAAAIAPAERSTDASAAAIQPQRKWSPIKKRKMTHASRRHPLPPDVQIYDPHGVHAAGTTRNTVR